MWLVPSYYSSNSNLNEASYPADYNKKSTVSFHSSVYDSPRKCVAVRVLVFLEFNKTLIEPLELAAYHKVSIVPFLSFDDSSRKLVAAQIFIFLIKPSELPASIGSSHSFV